MIECDRNCLECPFDDCIVESASEAEITASRVEDREILTERLKGVKGANAARRRYELSDKGRAAHKRYRISEKGKATLKRYVISEKGKAALKRYELSDKGRERQRRYLQSEKGREMLRRRTQEKIKSGKNAEYCRRYYQRRKELNAVRDLQSTIE